MPVVKRHGQMTVRILAVGDSYMPARYFREAFGALEHDPRGAVRRGGRDVAYTPDDAVELQAHRVPRLAASARRSGRRRRGARSCMARRSPTRCSQPRRTAACRLRARRARQRRRRRDERSRPPAGQHAGKERRGGRGPDARVHGHARPRTPEGVAVPRGREPGPRTTGRARGSWDTTCASIRSGSSGTGRSASGSPIGRGRSG